MTDQRTASYQIVDEGSLHKYRTEIPNTVIRGLTGRGLSLPARWLYVYLKSVAGDSGESWQNTTTLAKGAQLGRGTIARAKRELIKACLIAVESQGHNAHATDRIRILDIWTDNMREFATPHCSPHEQSQVPLSADVHTCNGSDCSPQKHYCSPQKHYCSPQEPKKISLRRSPEEGKPLRGATQTNLDKGTSPGFERFWQAYPLKKAKGSAWTAWRKLHLDPLAERICASIADHLAHDTEWQRGFIKHPATFLNAHCWEDELTPVALPCPPPKRRGLVL
jgi:hypothetical protein